MTARNAAWVSILFVLFFTGCRLSGLPTSTDTPTPATLPPTETPTATRKATRTLPPADMTLEEYSSEIIAGLSGEADRNILVLVNSQLYPALADELDVLEQDLRNENWIPVVSMFPVHTPFELREGLQAIYFQQPFSGVWLVGDFPYERLWGYPIENPDQPGPSDYYYMDLDGEWTDTNHDTFYDVHSNGAGDRAPEIFAGRLHGSNVAELMGEEEADLMKEYFRRNHAYRTGALPTAGAALYAAPNDHYYGLVASDSASWAQQEIQSIRRLFGKTYLFIYSGAEGPSNEWAAEFWPDGNQEEKTFVPAQARFFDLMGGGYDYLSIGIHSWTESWGGDFFTSAAAAAMRKSGGQAPIFIFSGACSIADIYAPNSLGAALSMSGALALLGYSASSEMTWEEFRYWNENLATLPAGLAFLALQNLATPDESGPVTRNVNWILLGDPTLRLRTKP